MPNSEEFNLHTDILCDNLRTFLEEGAVEVGALELVGSGLLNWRFDTKNDYFRPRLVVVLGAASIVGRAIEQDVPVDVMIVGATREDDLTATMGKIFTACHGVARDVLDGRDLDDWEVAKLSHSIRIAERETLSTDQAKFYLQRIYEPLGESRTPNQAPTSY